MTPNAGDCLELGYHLVQQWKVGSYRLDIVAVCGKEKVAIECDGERWHSGEEKIREDMERQTILERCGWRFIRIRGSEFYRDSEKTIERVIAELTGFGIEPENTVEQKEPDRKTELLKRVKTCAASILYGEGTVQPEQDQVSIAVALDPKTLVPDNEPQKPLKAPADVTKEPESKQPVNSAEIKSEPAKPEPAKPVITKPVREKPTPPAVPPKKPYSKATHATSRQQILQEASSLGKASPNKAKGDDFVKELQDHGIELTDNRAQSNIVWVLYSADKKGYVESVISKFECKSTLEKRGAIATHNRPAWRVMFLEG